MEKLYPHIQWMIRRDFPEVLEIENLAFPHDPWTEEDFIRVLRQPSAIGKVAKIGDEVIGFTVFDLQKTFIEIWNLAVHPSLWRRGVGTALVDNVRANLRPRRTRMFTHSADFNLPGQLFLKANGFRCTEIKKNYYPCWDCEAYLFELQTSMEFTNCKLAKHL